MSVLIRTPDGDYRIELPPGVTIHGGGLRPLDAELGDLWVDVDGSVYRSMLGPACPTCHRPGAATWELLPEGLRRYAI